MFLGHFAVGLAVKKSVPKVHLGWTFLACQLLDLVWPVFVLLGWERVVADPDATRVTGLDFVHYPYSHSLLMAIVWSVFFAALMGWRYKDRRVAWVLGLLVLSHWFLDAIVHRPDLPVWPGGPQVGLAVWNMPVITALIEGLLFATGIWLYTDTTERTTPRARWLFLSLMIFLASIALLNAFGPPPRPGTPSAAIAIPALAMWILVGWAYLADNAAHLRREGADLQGTWLT